MLRERCQFHAQAVSQVVNLQATREALVRLGFQANPLPLWGWLSFTNSPPPLPLTLSHTLSSALPPVCSPWVCTYACRPFPRWPHDPWVPTPRQCWTRWSCCPRWAPRRESCCKPSLKGAIRSAPPSSPCRRPASRAQNRSVSKHSHKHFIDMNLTSFENESFFDQDGHSVVVSPGSQCPF